MCILFLVCSKRLPLLEGFVVLKKVSQVPDSKTTIAPPPQVAFWLHECATTLSNLPYPEEVSESDGGSARLALPSPAPHTSPRMSTSMQIVPLHTHTHTAHRKFVYWPLFLSSNVQEFETVIWNRFHLLCVLDQTKEAPSHAQMLLQKPAFQSLQKPCRIKCVNFFIFVQFLSDFLLVTLNWIKFIWGVWAPPPFK